MLQNEEFNALIANLSKRTSLAPADVELIRSSFTRQEFSKRDILLEAGSTSKHIYYIATGTLRSYIHANPNKEVVIMLAFQDWWITDIDSFTTGAKSQINIDALSKGIVYGLSRENFDTLIESSPAFESAFRYMMQYSYIREQRRALELITDSTEVRYAKLLARLPTIEQDVSQKNIASYLGVSPEFLSKLKRKRKTEVLT